MQGSLPAGGLHLCREGVEPSGPLRKVSGYIHPPSQDFPDASWAHVRRGFYDLHLTGQAPLATEALRRIGLLYAVEEEIRGKPPDVRARVRQARVGPVLEDLHAWFRTTLGRISGRSDLAGAIRYALARWEALTRYVADGRLEPDNNPVERAIRPLILGRKNWLCAGDRIPRRHRTPERPRPGGLPPRRTRAHRRPPRQPRRRTPALEFQAKHRSARRLTAFRAFTGRLPPSRRWAGRSPSQEARTAPRPPAPTFRHQH
jgi:hypothetical protein